MGQGDTTGEDRRPIPQREQAWAARLSNALYAARIRPNQISVASVVIAVAGAFALLASAGGAGRAWWLLGAAVCIPLRLLFNMLDGMLAVEKGLHTATGDLFNEVPDRIADVALLAAAGYATAGLVVTGGGAWGPADLGVLTGWIAASAAVLTAYVRTLGAANGVGNFFSGPMPKPIRMWVLTLACLVSMVEGAFAPRGAVLLGALVLIAAGSILTVAIRLARIVRALKARAA